MNASLPDQPRIELAIVDNSVKRADRGGFVWLSVGAASPPQPKGGMSEGPAAVGTRLVRRDRGASIACIDQRDPTAPSLHLWRGLFSSYDWFVATSSDGQVTVSDDFRSALASLPVADRTPSEDGIIQHYLYRTVFGTGTYISRIRRLGAGEHLEIDVALGSTTGGLIDRAASETDLVEPAQYLDVVEAALESIVAPLRHRPDVQLSFSGGVDSTLLARLLGSDVRMTTVVPGTPEFAVETSYARLSARLLDMPLEELVTSEQSYLGLLESTIDDTGRPPRHDIIPLISLPFRDRAGDVFVIGEGADGYFGTGGRAAKIANYLRQQHLRGMAAGIARLAPSGIRARATMVVARGAQFAADPLSAEGFAATAEVYGDPSFIRRVAGPDKADDMLLSILQYTLDRVDMSVPNDPFYQHLELAQWQDAFADHIRIHREAARAHRAELVAPFVMEPMITALSRLPVADRHLKGFTGKWLMKEMLSARLPAYQVDKRKLHTSLPFKRYCTDGPLTRIWDRYEIPDLFEGKDREGLIANSSDEGVLWNAISHAIWDARVVQNASLTPNVPIVSISIEAGQDPDG